ncbi:MAG: ABC transporter ATP-binding protein [Rhizobiaceae bacterium]|nr:ABC transporter ATP-binding protein [Rhizobiaceae bacterium]
MTKAIISIRDLGVRFGGVEALKKVSVDVPEGSIYGIIGPNGAGKTTLFNCISGFIRPTPQSRVEMFGEDITWRDVAARSRLGISRTFQNISLVRTETARWNIVAGLHSTLEYGLLRAVLGLPSVARAERRAEEKVEEVAAILGLSNEVLNTRVEYLPIGLQKLVELARALARQPRLLLLDEPASGLNNAETGELLESLKVVGKIPGVTIILVDHDMELVMPLCDRICVLNFGEKIAEGTPKEVTTVPAVLESYLGPQYDA